MSDPRLLTEKNIWLATVRPDGRPHLVPIWFISLNEKVYICTEGKSVKIKNIQAIISLERATRGKRSLLDRITDGVSTLASSPAFIVVHLVMVLLTGPINQIRAMITGRYAIKVPTGEEAAP